MTGYAQRTKEELQQLKKELEKQYEDAKGKGLKLDMSRGKPSAAQLDLSMGMMDVLTSESVLKTEAGRTAAITAFWTVFRRPKS